MIVAIIGGVLLLGCVVIGVLIALLLPAVSKVRGAAARVNDQNNMKQLILGTMNYESTYGKLPPAQEKVSWRVYLLPYIEQAQLYNQFKIDEPWDSPANRRHANTPVKVFLSASDPSETVETHYRVFVGPNTLYEPGNPPLPLKEVKDGVDTTIFIVEARETVPWPQPRELEYDRNSPLPTLGVPGRNGFNVAMLDGSVKFVTDKTSGDAIRGGIEPNDGRTFDP
jgi:prepilin-type processing-associated H-X9-DG protein